MANNLNMGQLRFTGDGCVSNMGFSVTSKKVAIGTSEDSSATSFYDIEIKPNSGTFAKDSDYYIKIAIPQDMNYEMSFNLKLTKKENNTTTVYQFLRNLTIDRGGSGSNVYNVVLYENSDGEISAMIPLPYLGAGTSNTKDLLYYNSANDRYYLGNGDSTYTMTDKVNEISAAASWKTQEGDKFGVFELTFRPVEADFSSILLEMVRTAEDYSIQHIGDNGEMFFGRIVDPEKVKKNTVLYSINNLVPKMNANGPLSRIGVWSHPGLQMTVNGEPIQVGPSGYYEIDILPITSLGIVAPNGDYSNNWTVDYTYDPTIKIETA